MATMLGGCLPEGYEAAGTEHEEETTEENNVETEAETETDEIIAQDQKEGFKISLDDKSQKSGGEYATLKEQMISSELIELSNTAGQVYTFIYTPTEEYEYGEDYVPSKTYYSLYVTGDDTGTLVETYNYSETYANFSKYNGKIDKEESKIIFTYEDDYGYIQAYTFALDSRDRVTDVSTTGFNATAAMAAGTYTCDDPQLGLLTLEVSKMGTAVLKYEDGTELSGHFATSGDRYNFYCYDENDENLVLDWYVDCSVNGTFKHVPYSSYEVDFDGTYEMFGSLGTITVTVDDTGKAYATIEINGEAIDFSGTAYSEDGEGGSTSYPTNIYLYSEGGYSMDLNVVDLGGEDGLNYSGTYTLPLAAG